MGNSIRRGGGGGGDATGKIILSDGSVHRYETPVTVAEVMLEYPQQLVFEVQASFKTVAMPADKMLEKNKVYLIAPMKKGRPSAALSAEEASKILLKANCYLKSNSFLASTYGVIPLLARMCQANRVMHGRGGSGSCEGKREADAKRKSSIVFQSDELKDDVFAEFLEGRPDYLSKQLSGRGWKPSLNTIKEKSIKTNVRHWLV